MADPNVTPIWMKSRAERSAAFEKASTGMVPLEQKVPTLTEQIRLVLPLIRKKRNQGFTSQQIADMMRKPDIGIDASSTSIRRELSRWDRRQAELQKQRLAALLPKGPSAAGQAAAGSRTRPGQ